MTELEDFPSVKVGLLVVRGRRWRSGDDTDGGAGSVGVVVRLDAGGVWVMWSRGEEDCYPKSWLATAAGETNREGKEGRRTNQIHYYKTHSLSLCNGFEYANEIQEWEERGERRVRRTGKGRKDAGPTKFITTRPTPSDFVTDSNMHIRYKSGIEEVKGG
jgi:hypothetical protein